MRKIVKLSVEEKNDRQKEYENTVFKTLLLLLCNQYLQ